MPVIERIAPPKNIEDLRHAILILLTDHFAGFGTIDGSGNIIEVEFGPSRVRAVVAVIDRNRHTGSAFEIDAKFGDESEPVL